MTERIAGYDLISEIARSPSGRILLAQSPGSQQLLAIKEMLLEPDSGLSDEEQIARFKREADIHLQLNHANIVKAIEAGVDGDRHYLVMEYQPGHTWRDLMELERPPLPQILEWGLQLCHALQALHDIGVVHRDVKPANCLVSPAGQLKITDFGMARRAFAPGITQSKMMLGTLNYMSPEQLLDATSVDGRADVFAVGVILFKALTGELPFPGASPTDVAHRLLYAEPTDPLTLNPRLPKSLAERLLKCLAKDPDYRYLSADSFARDLETELSNPELFIAQGQIHAERGEWKDANHCFQQAVSLDNSHAEAWFNLGESLQNLGQPDPASECFLKVVNLDSSHVRSFRSLGNSYRASGNLQAAIKMFQRAWVLEPSDRETCLALGMTYREDGMNAEALEQLTILAEQNPDWGPARLELGRLLYAGDQVERARSEFAAARRLMPTDPDALFNLASASHELGLLADAEEAYEQLLCVMPEHAKAHHNLAYLWLTQDRLAEAEEHLAAAISHEPWAPSYLLLGSVLQRTGRLKEAIALYQKALELAPRNPDASIALAHALQLNYQPNAAIDVIQQATEVETPRAAELYYQLALAYRIKGEDVEAAGAIANCLASSPDPDLKAHAEALAAQLNLGDRRGTGRGILGGRRTAGGR
jgi:serine/threonine protein kinase